MHFSLFAFHWDSGRYELIGSYPNVDMALQVGRRLHTDFYVERMSESWSEASTSYLSVDEKEPASWWTVVKEWWLKLWGCK
jgi:hypothetical protein